MKKVKKGFTMVEVVIGITLSILLIDLILTSMMILIKEYKSYIGKEEHYYYLLQASNLIEYEIKNSPQYIRITNNSIYIRNKDKTPRDEKASIIKISGNKIIVLRKNHDITETSNNIAKDITDFEVYQKENIVFVKITSNKGVTIERCLPISLK